MASKRNPAKRPRPGRRPIVALIMGSTSDWETMRHAAETLDALGIPYERRVMSAHRTPRLMFTYATAAAARGLRVVIGGAGGAAHLPGMMAALTTIPVLGVPVESASLKGMDSLLSIVQMPGGVPVATFAIGRPGERRHGDVRHRQAGRDKRGPFRGGDPRPRRPGDRPRPFRLPLRAEEEGPWRQAPVTGPRYFGSRSDTRAFSSLSSFSVAAIFDFEKSVSWRPWTMLHLDPSLRMGKEKMRPFSIP